MFIHQFDSEEAGELNQKNSINVCLYHDNRRPPSIIKLLTFNQLSTYSYFYNEDIFLITIFPTGGEPRFIATDIAGKTK